MNAPTASQLADYLATQLNIYGSLTHPQAERLLFNKYRWLTRMQIVQGIIVAAGRGQIARDHNGATLRRVK